MTAQHRYEPESRVTPNGALETVAGNGQNACAASGGPALQLPFRTLSGLDVTADGTIYLSDVSCHRIFEITPDGVARIVAGNGLGTTVGDGGAATAAGFRDPSDLLLTRSRDRPFTQTDLLPPTAHSDRAGACLGLQMMKFPTCALFRGDTFNVHESRPDFINPENYGDDVVRWLMEELRRRGIENEGSDWLACIERSHGIFLSIFGQRNRSIAERVALLIHEILASSDLCREIRWLFYEDVSRGCLTRCAENPRVRR